MPSIVVFPQIALRDVLARIATLDLDVDAFLGEICPHPASDDRASLLVRGLFTEPAELARLGVSEVWQALAEKVEAGAILAHPASPAFFTLASRMRAQSGGKWRTARVVQPVGVRTLMTRFDKPSWDFRAAPRDDLGGEGSLAELVDQLVEALRPTTGGAEFLVPDPRARALSVLSTTLAAVLSEEGATRSDHRRGAKLVRPDVYERAVEGMGLARFFQAIRRVVELDHPEHVPTRLAWPRPEDPVRDLGILETRGQRDPYLVLNAPALTKL